MPKMTQMMQRAYTMRKQMKRMQKELAKQTVEVKSNNGKVTVSVRGDMSVLIRRPIPISSRNAWKRCWSRP